MTSNANRLTQAFLDDDDEGGRFRAATLDTITEEDEEDNQSEVADGVLVSESAAALGGRSDKDKRGGAAAPVGDASVFASTFQLANCAIGAGVLAFPYGFANCGLAVGTLLLVYLTLIVGCAQVSQGGREEAVKCSTFSRAPAPRLLRATWREGAEMCGAAQTSLASSVGDAHRDARGDFFLRRHAATHSSAGAPSLRR
jgi:hypothetical protein